MSERPDWVKCIRRTRGDMPRYTTWCGSNDGFFESLDHAAENGFNGQRLVACKECVKIAVKYLKTGW